MVVYVCGLQLGQALAASPVQQHAKQSAASCCGACQRNDVGLCFMDGFIIVSPVFGSCREGPDPSCSLRAALLARQLGAGGGGGGLGGSLHGKLD